MGLWTFKCYISENGRDLIGDWYSSELSPKAKAKFDTLLEHFRDTPHTKWGSSYLRPLTGYEGIFEICFQVLNVVYRPLGFFGADRYEFTFLIGAREHGDRFEPKTAPDTAQERMGDVLINKERAHECNF